MTPGLIPAEATLLAVGLVRATRGNPPLLAAPTPPEIPFDPTQVRFYFYGAVGYPGHRWHPAAHYLADGPGMFHAPKGCPWGRDPDGTLPPYPVQRGRYPNPREVSFEQEQGVARLHHKGGWTAIGYWDRSGEDTRYGVNSNFIAEGTLTFEQMLTCACHYFPRIVNRVRSAGFPIRLESKPG